MGGNVIVTVYQTSGTCDQQAMQQFVKDFLSQMTAAGGAIGHRDEWFGHGHWNERLWLGHRNYDALNGVVAS